MKAAQKNLRPVLMHHAEVEIEWTAYPRVAPGQYPAYCRWAKKYYDPGFRRWVCLLVFDILSEDLLRVIASVPMWLALGTDSKPRASLRGKYLNLWVRANGEPPHRGDRLSPNVFGRRMARVDVGDTDPKKSPVPHSVVREVLHWETGVVEFNRSTFHTIKRT